MALLRSLNRIFTKPAVDDATVSLYHTIVTQSREPVFYERMGVPDTIDGRFDMLILHAILMMLRLRDEADARQKLFDFMFADMDRSLREMGVGDMSIGKKIRPMMQAFYGRAHAYEAGLVADDGTLVAALTKNLYGMAHGKAGDAVHAQSMARYVREAAANLERQSPTTILAGQVVFIAPADAA